MIYLTADTHGQIDIDKITVKKWPIQKQLNRNDYLIICGDMGLIWQNDKTYSYLLDFYTSRKYTVLFCEGNHSNHIWLNTFPIIDWHNGKVHQIADNIFHLMRGEIYNINDYKFLSIGGALSIDKVYRTPYIDWWPEEEINYEEQNYVLEQLDKNNWSVDYVITHAAPKMILKDMFPDKPQFTGKSTTEQFLEYVRQQLNFKVWYFGHYHLDRDLNKFHCLYNRVVELQNE